MRKQAVTIVLMTLLAGMVLGGCGGRVTEPKLVRADSLMDTAPDSALALLLTIDSTRLDGRANQAYYALLLTQARYKCYIPATGDSLINIAVDYYRHHGGRDCRVRSLAYKGCVMEEIGNVEDALRYYKEATAIAEKEDHKNQGFLKLRMAMLYQTSNTVDSADVLNLKEALGHYTELGDKHYMMVCARQLGMDYMQCDSAKHYLSIALLLSRELCDTASYNLTLLGFAEHDALNSHDYSSALNHIRQIEDIATPNPETDEISLLAALSWAKLGRKDSSELYLSKTKRVTSLPDSLIFLETTAELAKMSGDMEKYAQLTTHRYQKADSAMLASLQIQLADVEHKYDNQKLKESNLLFKMRLVVLGVVLCVVAVLFLLTLVLLQRKRLKIAAYQETVERLAADVEELGSQSMQSEIVATAFSDVIKNQIDVFTRLMDTHDKFGATRPEKFVEQFRSSFKMTDNQHSFWKGIKEYVNGQYNHILDEAKSINPALNETDIQLLCLLCCKLPPTTIMLCMGYNEIHSLYNKKRILSRKLKLVAGFEDFINSFERTAKI